jgi:putative adhesin
MSRSSIVAMLVAVEVLIVGIGLYALRGPNGFSVHHGGSFTPAAIAPLAAGSAPQIDIDDPDSHVDVLTSSDGQVHVIDKTRAGGFWGGGSIPQLHVSRTPAGVAISRPGDGGTHWQFGYSDRRIEVDVPAGAHLTVARCSGAAVTGIQGGAEVHSLDGRITMTDVRGQALLAHSDDGRVVLDGATANSIDATSKDGRIVASRITMTGDAPHAVLQTDDGLIDAAGSFASGGNYEMSTKDGTVRVALQHNADLTVDASTEDGKIYVDGDEKARGDDDSSHHTVRLGNGSGSLHASTNDGSIHITTNGAV